MADLRGKIALVTGGSRGVVALAADARALERTGGAYKTGDLAVSTASPVLTERNHRRSASSRI